MKNRHSIRLKNFDYSNNGYYFVTICVQNKLDLFWKNEKFVGVDRCVDPKNNGIIKNKRADTSVRPYMEYLNEIGQLIKYWWNEIPNHFNNIKLDEFVIMPDHIHGIIVIKNINKYGKLGNIIQWFKTMLTNEYIKNVKINNWPKFDKRLFQRNYYERIIRNEREYLNIQKYIELNPVGVDRCVDPNDFKL